MKFLRSFFPWPGKKDDPQSDDDVVLDPVVLIPGIGGSVLEAVSDNGRRERIWVRLLNADHEFRTKLWSKYNPETGRTESLDKTSHVEVPQANYGLYAVDTLDPDLKIPLDMVNYYHNMMLEMRKWGYQDGKDLFGFGFDFRQSNRLPETMEELRNKLKAIHEQTGKKVTVITHSMGGLLMKSFLALYHEEVAAHVGTWIAIAAPFRGAPGFILDTLLTGVEFLKGWEKDLFVAKWSMHQLLVECPSIYELIAEYEFEWEEKPELRIVRPNDGADGVSGEVNVDTISSHHELIGILDEALRDNVIKLKGGETIPIPLSKSIVEWAKETRQLWTTAKIPEGVQFFNIYGTGLDTPFHCTYGSEKSPINDLKEILHCEAAFDNVDGDGTVPLESSRADGLDAIYRVGVPGEHRGLLRDARVFRLVKFFMGVPEIDLMYDPMTDFVLAPSRHDVEEAMAASLLKVREDEDDAEVVGKDDIPAVTNTEGGDDVEVVVTESFASLGVDMETGIEQAVSLVVRKVSVSVATPSVTREGPAMEEITTDVFSEAHMSWEAHARAEKHAGSGHGTHMAEGAPDPSEYGRVGATSKLGMKAAAIEAAILAISQPMVMPEAKAQQLGSGLTLAAA